MPLRDLYDPSSLISQMLSSSRVYEISRPYALQINPWAALSKSFYWAVILISNPKVLDSSVSSIIYHWWPNATIPSASIDMVDSWASCIVRVVATTHTDPITTDSPVTSTPCNITTQDWKRQHGILIERRSFPRSKPHKFLSYWYSKKSGLNMWLDDTTVPLVP